MTNDKAMELAREIFDMLIADPPEMTEAEFAEFLRPHLKPEWRPIETAPKDGTEIVLPLNTGRVTAGFFDIDNGNGEPHFDDWVAPFHDGYDTVAPTHWQPIPEPPKENHNE